MLIGHSAEPRLLFGAFTDRQGEIRVTQGPDGRRRGHGTEALPEARGSSKARRSSQGLKRT